MPIYSFTTPKVAPLHIYPIGKKICSENLLPTHGDPPLLANKKQCHFAGYPAWLWLHKSWKTSADEVHAVRWQTRQLAPIIHANLGLCCNMEFVDWSLLLSTFRLNHYWVMNVLRLFTVHTVLFRQEPAVYIAYVECLRLCTVVSATQGLSNRLRCALSCCSTGSLAAWLGDCEPHCLSLPWVAFEAGVYLTRVPTVQK